MVRMTKLERNQCSGCGRMNKDSAVTCINCHTFLKEPYFKAALWDSLIETKNPRMFELWARLYEETGSNKKEINRVHEISDFFTEKQRGILDVMLKKDSKVSVLGCRKSGKSWLGSSASILLGIRDKIQVKILSAKKETANHIVWQIGEISDKYDLGIIKSQSIEKISFLNGTRVSTLANTIGGTGTFEADILIIDEAQEIAPEIWSKVLPMILTGKANRLWILGTAQAGSKFDTFWHLKDDRFKYYELRKEDCTWVKPEDWILVGDNMDDRMRRQELELEWVEKEGAYFKATDIEKAYEPWINSELNSYKEIISSWDWGLGHATVGMVLGVTQNNVVEEIDVWQKYNPSAEEILTKCSFWKDKYSPFFIFEGSPLGGFVRKELNKHFKSKMSNFASRKDKFWLALEILLDKNLLRLNNTALKQELKRYCGDKKEDDHVDALLHCIYYVYNKYVKKSNVSYKKLNEGR